MNISVSLSTSAKTRSSLRNSGEISALSSIVSMFQRIL